MKRLIVLTFLSTLFICCHGEEVEMPEDVYRMVSKDKTRWIANARGAKALERFRVVDDLGAPVPRARIEGVWGTPSSNAATFEGLTDSKGVFTADESKRILEAGKRFGLMPKIHADEIEAIGGSELAGKIGAVSAEHLIVVRRSGIRSMAEGNVIACLLPATSFYLNAEFAPARAFIDEGVAVALGSDYNPGSCPSLNLQFVMNLACLKYRLTPEEMLTAVTLNASAAIGLSGITGSVEKGKQADLVFWNAEDLDYLAYRMGSNLVRAVVKKGKVVYER